MMIICSDRIEDYCAECDEEAWHWTHTSSTGKGKMADREAGLHKFRQRPPHETGKRPPSPTCDKCGHILSKEEARKQGEKR